MLDADKLYLAQQFSLRFQIITRTSCTLFFFIASRETRKIVLGFPAFSTNQFFSYKKIARMMEQQQFFLMV
jgi:hypothetical protein